MEKKYIKIIDSMVLVGTLAIILISFVLLKPDSVSPLSGMVVSEEQVLFSFNNGQAILLDDNPGFTSPQRIIVEDSLLVNLKPGNYYWKVEGPGGVLESKVRNFSIASRIELKLKKASDNSELSNTGNVPANIEVYNTDELTDNFIIKTDAKQNITGSYIEGGQHE